MTHIDLNKRFIFLDYLRIIACLLVVMGHKFSGFPSFIVESSTFLPSMARSIQQFLLYISSMGGAGVVIFFLISGYVIRHAVLRNDGYRFILRRFFRIYPSFIVACLISSYISGQLTFENILILIPQFFLLGDIFGIPYGLGGVEWTLRLEMYFYLYFFLCRIAGLLKSSSNPVLYIATTLLLYQFGPLPSVFGWSHGYYTLYFPALLCGSAVYEAEFGNSCRNFLIIFIVFSYFLHIHQLSQFGYDFSFLTFLNVGVCFFFGLWSLRNYLPNLSLVDSVAATTYALYLYHTWLWDTIRNLFSSFIALPILPTATLLILICFSYCIYYLIERPCITYSKYITR